MNFLDVKCPFPIRPDNGFVNYPAKEALGYKDKATYGCHDTYVLDGPEEVECNKFGNWSAQPSCKGMKHGWVLKMSLNLSSGSPLLAPFLFQSFST